MPGDENMVRSTCDLRVRNKWSAAASGQRPTMDKAEDEQNQEFSAEDNEDDEERSQSSYHWGGNSNDSNYTPFVDINLTM